jgi:hypothetical protein
LLQETPETTFFFREDLLESREDVFVDGVVHLLQGRTVGILRGQKLEGSCAITVEKEARGRLAPELMVRPVNGGDLRLEGRCRRFVVVLSFPKGEKRRFLRTCCSLPGNRWRRRITRHTDRTDSKDEAQRNGACGRDQRRDGKAILMPAQQVVSQASQLREAHPTIPGSASLASVSPGL